MNDSQTLTPYRCAIYFAPPPESPWGEAGSQWLGRCTATQRSLPLPSIGGVEAKVHSALIAEPRRYGWHATLKAPFALAPGADMAAVLASLRQLAGEFSAFDLPALEVDRQGAFLAMRPSRHCPALQEVASACVTRLHGLALPLDAAELARRRRTPLTTEQDLLLQRWGYPWVLDHFHFHFSLTGSLEGVPAATRAQLADAAQGLFEPLGPCRFDRLALFVETHKGADFQWVASAPLRP